MSGAIREGLIIGDVLCDERAANRTIIVTVNGHVTLTEGRDFFRGMQFTFEQWAEVVKFVEAHMPCKECEPMYQPDWSIIDCIWMYFAIDANGTGIFYENEPKVGVYADEWIPNGDFLSVYKFPSPLAVDWKSTLCRRVVG